MLVGSKSRFHFTTEMNVKLFWNKIHSHSFSDKHARSSHYLHHVKFEIILDNFTSVQMKVEASCFIGTNCLHKINLTTLWSPATCFYCFFSKFLLKTHTVELLKQVKVTIVKQCSTIKLFGSRKYTTLMTAAYSRN